MYITDQTALNEFTERAKHSKVLAIDTEFLREKTYYAKLCLLQIATDSEIVVIDPFQTKNLRVLTSLLVDKGITKVFHAPNQDLEIIYRDIGVLPNPIFDTQIAAALLGHTQQIGYASLVQAECGVRLKKMDSFTDWSKRPLSRSQLQYAAEDVIYLPKLYTRMKKSLEKQGRLSWLDSDFAELSDPQQYCVSKRTRYRKLKKVSQLSRKQLSAAREVAAWREEMAQKRNIPRKWVITDEQVVEACKREARTIDELFMVRGMSDRLSTEDARAVVELVVKGLNAPQEEWPEKDRGNKHERNVDAELDLMNALVRLRAKENNVAVPTLATHDELVRLARGHTKDLELLRGWRKALIGDELCELLAGKLYLCIEDGALKVTDISQ